MPILPYRLLGEIVAALAIAALSYLLVTSYKSNGELQARLSAQTQYSAGLKSQLDEANAKINSTAKAGAISYGQCQDVISNNATQSFDLGVTFGRSTCPAPSSPSSVSPVLH